MSIIQCRECQKEVSSQAESCPHCGVAAPDEALAQSKLKNPRTAFWLGLCFGPVGMLYSTVMGAAVMFFLVGFLGFLGFTSAFAVWRVFDTGSMGSALLAIIMIWLFSALPCGLWARRAVLSSNQRFGVRRVAPPAKNGQSSRPRWVWVICIFFLISAGLSVCGAYDAFLFSGIIPLREAVWQYWGRFWASQSSVGVLVVALLNLAGAVFLLLLRRQAFYLFLSAFVLNIVLTAYQIITKHFLAAIGGPGIIGVFFGWAIGTTILFYAYRLMKRGVLT
jgi:hypothetical protein